jgi:hypothetical protein
MSISSLDHVYDKVISMSWGGGRERGGSNPLSSQC